MLEYKKDLVDSAVSDGSVSPEIGVPGACVTCVFMELYVHRMIGISDSGY